MLAAVFNSRTAFYQQWNRYESQPPADAISGRWIGEWISDQSGHKGDLKCVMAPIDHDTYRAHFYATFSKFFRVGYATDLKLEKSDGKALLKGEEDLGALAGGVYRCKGELLGSEFICHYSCKYDQGIFKLHRFQPG